ncbi:LacI family DNA-binding transcriptional regulator [Victivallis sp. Marseille-Q1083]|uniref:LacI family DNA-binding transcriptional regulator n=1 Tax=Victivallis sp. Marseille-Q1083 TaxID=2717288 RepID=UPI00158A19A8|nr:LacI family DNA-binding transcriptional regulator [Victivallis sp. Marseille-Q1083]
MAVTIKDIALRAGVSHQAVSAVLNGKSNCRVSEKTRQRILACAGEMAYRPNYSARWLKSRRTQVITVVAYPLLREGGFGMEFHPPFLGAESLQQISCAIRERGFAMKLEYAWPGTDLKTQCREIVNPNLTDGIIFYGYHGNDFNELLEKINLPYLFFGHYIEVERRDVPLLGLQRRTGIRCAVRSLLASGRSRIAYCGVAANPSLPLLREELELAGVYEAKRIHLVGDYYDLRRWLESCRPGCFDAVICSNDVVANWLYRELQYRGIPVPDEVAIVGYDNDPSYDFISTIGLDSAKFHARAVELLTGSIEHPSREKIHEVFQTEYFPRQTTPNH